MIRYRLLLLKKEPIRWLLPVLVAFLTVVMIALGLQKINTQALFATLLWITIFMTTVSLFREIFLLDSPEMVDQLKLSPLTPIVDLLSRGVVAVLILIVLQCVILTLFLMLLGMPLEWIVPYGILILLLGNIGYVVLGMMIGALTRNLRGLWLPLLLYPLLIPLLMITIQGSMIACRGVFDPYWGGLLIGMDLIYIALFIILAEPVLE